MSDFTLEHVSSYEPVVAGATAFPHLISPVVWVNELELEIISAIDIGYGEFLDDGMVTGQYESNELWVSSLKYPVIGSEGAIHDTDIQPVAEIIMQPYIVDLYYNPPDVIFAGYIKGFSGRSTYVQQISYMRMLPEEPLSTQNEVFGKDEYTYVGMFGNNQMITQTASGSIRPGSGFVYPRKI